ncbi:hypothetical protein [Microbispora sp. NPDC049633]|uniref:hypothetical protein n=1 Tax=Microbispora sp. NPDC049633 TaxID=3154355 RepID=UPI0034267E69
MTAVVSLAAFEAGGADEEVGDELVAPSDISTRARSASRLRPNSPIKEDATTWSAVASVSSSSPKYPIGTPKNLASAFNVLS